MTKRKQIVAGNWKMNMDYEQGRDLTKAVIDGLQPSDALVILGTPFIHLRNVASIIKDISNLKLAAQNCHQEESGAYTGEVSASMLKSCGVEYVILGHSERREYFGEKDELIAKKIDAVLGQGMEPIYCCGEKLDVRESGKQNELVAEQVKTALFHLSAEDLQKVVIAYEPVWAIGTGKTASPAQAQEMHAHIRSLIRDQYGAEIADSITILYGGSVKPGNAKELFANPDVDGGLIGGASLKAADFNAIVDSF
ncbi:MULTISPECIES: triose-phosphate isomerase [Phaeodactylibacter]|jgi:triosephosphate isomerase|uniref:Triosephosphate isomerase n=2 Tax=Phaeodactylibacter TaxID=1564515 RepID=A0A098S2R3_9BACT|nr:MULTISPECIES: triose-phosphate isomerase [Phaeodactylibacter]KGE86415.1 triosephosphate isomerase [Phaeodactylibacter xiamenensis]MCI5091030.1 triose-phosphate isomerase [Phaeodactylibacter sp.]MCR9054528.1 triose-phosphate isomerase [bacterium]